MKRLALLLLLLLPPLLPAPLLAEGPALGLSAAKVEAGAEAAQAIPLKRIDWRHILSGQINAFGQATGFHYAGVDFVPRSARVVKAGKPDSRGVVRAKVEIFNPKSGEWIAKKSDSTLFPSSWTRGQLEKEVEAAYQTAKLTRMLDGGSWGWRSAAPSGIHIQGVVDMDGTVRTAYPIREAAK
ncbi:exported hypothetical protein [Rhodospirillaceae bacterium LM-1]|nr:exported hypothetical protein [Rhodospirillaceae bacterium LM-1]